LQRLPCINWRKKEKEEEVNILILMAERNVEHKESKNRLSQYSLGSIILVERNLLKTEDAYSYWRENLDKKKKRFNLSI